LNACPDCRVILAAIGRAGGAGGCPIVGAGIISPAGVQIVNRTIIKKSAPDDHLAASPDCRVRAPHAWRVSSAGGCPTVCARIISPAGVQIVAKRAGPSAPDDHFSSGPDRCVIRSAIGRVGGAGGCPTIGNRIVSPARTRRSWGWNWSARWGRAWGWAWAWVWGWGWSWGRSYSAPDDHLTASPDCCVKGSGSGRADGAGGYPTVRAGIISPAGV